MSALPGEFLVLDELAIFIEENNFAPVTIVYTGRAVDPTNTEPLTVSLIPYPSGEQYDPTDEEVRFQLVVRGSAAYAVASACYAGIGGKELRLPSGRWVNVIAIQSTPFIVAEEEHGWRVAQNFRLQYEVAEP